MGVSRLQESQRQELESLGRRLLQIVDPNPDRPGLQETPRRWAKMWLDFMYYEPGTMDTVFTQEHTDQMVVISGMRVWSLCEHHLVPFWCDVAVGYVTHGKVIGLSKVARMAHHHAHGLQVQERLVEQIADSMSTATDSPDVAVLASGEHLCMTMRGIKTPALVRSSAMRGVFREDHRARAEFFALAR